MAQQRNFTQAELKQAAERAVRQLQREAASAQLKGANIHPHALGNAQSWMTEVFTQTTPRHGVLPLNNYVGALFGFEDPRDELQRAFAYGLHAGFAELHLQMPEKLSPRSKAPVFQIGSFVRIHVFGMILSATLSVSKVRQLVIKSVPRGQTMYCLRTLLFFVVAFVLTTGYSARADIITNGRIGAYNATTGAPINADLITGLQTAEDFALSGNILFVPNYTLDTYNATTGALINPSFIAQVGTLAISGNTLYVANPGTDTIGTYDATTGAAINANFITGLSIPYRLTVSANTLFLTKCCDGVHNGVATYNAATGVAINPNFLSLSDPIGVAVSGNILFVSDFGSGVAGAGTIAEYDANTGAPINAHFITGLNPSGITVSGNTLFVVNTSILPLHTIGAGTVGKYDATTGGAINADLITGLTLAQSVAVSGNTLFVSNIVPAAPTVPEPSTWSMIAVGGVGLLGIMLRRERRTIKEFFLVGERQ